MCDDNALAKEFEKRFGVKPEIIVRAPGRVNLIGEHIDYSGYGVLPMAIEQSVTAAVSLNNTNELVIENVDAKYESHRRNKDLMEIVEEGCKPEWHHYFMCGYRGMVEHVNDRPTVGMNVLVEGEVPPSAGLSSSSALVCCACLCTLAAITGGDFDVVDRTNVATVCAKCEKYIGTEGGGMDQAICILAEQGKAKRIDFNPISARSVPLPDDVIMVVAHSLTQLNKAATAHYNTRVAECRLAAQVLAHYMQIPSNTIRTLGELQEKLGVKKLPEMVELARKWLHTGNYALEEIATILNVQQNQLQDMSLSARTRDVTEFKLLDRSVHVYSEAHRVNEFERVCVKGDEDTIARLGEIMNDSHKSCAVLYECSCDELDQLVKCCREGGALGSRLTGAGWGGCVVSAVHKNNIHTFLQSLKHTFYNDHQEKFSKAVFVSSPAQGANVTRL